jgi:BirA family biotin operon repressor/biotin-[acetyl-CoA-carboxylase] ligase
LRAEQQSGGRGRQGRDWVSPPGNLYASTLVRLRPNDPPAATLALVAAVALDEAVRAYINLFPGEGRGPVATGPILGPGLRRGTMIKWPNDLLIDGAKLSGILLERSGDAVVIGIGTNLAHHPELPDRPATSLAAHGITVDAASFLETLAETFARWLAKWRGEGLAPIRARWIEHAHPSGTALTARLPDGSSIDGLFERLDADGALILRLADGTTRVIHAADVFLL